MGILISRFKPPTRTILEEIEKKLEKIEELQQYAIKKRKKFDNEFLFIFVSVFLVTTVVFVLISSFKKLYYFLDWQHFLRRKLWLFHRFFHWYFTCQIVSCSEKSLELRKKKNQILDEVKQKETYNVAKELLDRFGDEPQQNNSLKPKPMQHSTPSPEFLPYVTDGTELRQRPTAISHEPKPERTPSPYPQEKLRGTEPCQRSTRGRQESKPVCTPLTALRDSQLQPHIQGTELQKRHTPSHTPASSQFRLSYHESTELYLPLKSRSTNSHHQRNSLDTYSLDGGYLRKRVAIKFEGTAGGRHEVVEEARALRARMQQRGTHLQVMEAYQNRRTSTKAISFQS